MDIKSINDLTIQQFIELSRILENYQGDIKDDMNIIKCISTLKEEELKEINYNIIKDIVEEIMVFFSVNINNDKLDAFRIGKKIYKFDFDLDKISTGQFVDLYNFTKDNIFDNLHIIAAILWRPVNWRGRIEKYDSKKVIERAELFNKNMKIDRCYSAAVFFWNLKSELLETTKEFLESQVKK